MRMDEWGCEVDVEGDARSPAAERAVRRRCWRRGQVEAAEMR